MIYVQLTTWLGIAALYLGFSMVMGILIRESRSQHGSRWMLALMLLHGFGLYLPASILVLASAGSPIVMRLLVAVSGLALLGFTVKQPSWLPSVMFQSSFLYRYFAASMLLACIWGISLALTTHAVSALVIGMCAIVAGTASLAVPGHIA